jgi:branched-chain amino acid transport system substrate-binding protein
VPLRNLSSVWQDVHTRKVERKDGQLWNVEFDVQKAVKDPGKLK